MKLHITVDDLFELTEEQERNLRRLWAPKERDLAVAYICSDAETNAHEAIVFTVGRVECQNQGRSNKFHIELRSLKLVDDSFYEDITREDDEVEDLEFEYQTPDDYFSYEYCLPLLSIGQMLEIINAEYCTDSDYTITYSRYEKRYELNEANPNSNPYSNHEPNELCDVLWEAVKTLL